MQEKKVVIHVIKVFVNKNNDFGNPVGIVEDTEHELNDNDRRKIAKDLNFSETVFIDNFGTEPVINIFNPIHKVKFAGHAVLGTVDFISKNIDGNVGHIICGKEAIQVNSKNGLTHIKAPLKIMPTWNYEKVSLPVKVEELSSREMANKQHLFVWAWINEKVGTVRARTFASDWGIPEDEANGSGSMVLASHLNRDLEIQHGKGSIIYARPINNDFAEVGGATNTEDDIIFSLV